MFHMKLLAWHLLFPCTFISIKADGSSLTGVPLETLRDTPGYDIGATGSNLFVVDAIRPHRDLCYPFKPHNLNKQLGDSLDFSNRTCYILDSVGPSHEVSSIESNYTVSQTSVIVQEGIDVVLDCAAKLEGSLTSTGYNWVKCKLDKCDAANFTDMNLPTDGEIENNITVDSVTENMIIFKLSMKHSGMTYGCTNGSVFYTWRFFIYTPESYTTEIIVLCCIAAVLFVGAAVLLLRDYIVYEKRYSSTEETETMPLTATTKDYASDNMARKRTTAAKEEVELKSMR